MDGITTNELIELQRNEAARLFVNYHLSMTWRERARTVVRPIVLQMGVSDPKATRKALREAYPFQEKRGYAYKSYLAECREQMGMGLREKKSDYQLRLF